MMASEHHDVLLCTHTQPKPGPLTHGRNGKHSVDEQHRVDAFVILLETVRSIGDSKEKLKDTAIVQGSNIQKELTS